MITLAVVPVAEQEVVVSAPLDWVVEDKVVESRQLLQEPLVKMVEVAVAAVALKTADKLMEQLVDLDVL